MSLDGQYAFLRGCIDTLMGSYRSNATITNGANQTECKYGATERGVSVPDGTRTVNDTGYIAIQFCKANAGNDDDAINQCGYNMKIGDLTTAITTAKNGQGARSFFDKNGCQEGSKSKLIHLV